MNIFYNMFYQNTKNAISQITNSNQNKASEAKLIVTISKYISENDTKIITITDGDDQIDAFYVGVISENTLIKCAEAKTKARIEEFFLSSQEKNINTYITEMTLLNSPNAYQDDEKIIVNEFEKLCIKDKNYIKIRDLRPGIYDWKIQGKCVFKSQAKQSKQNARESYFSMKISDGVDNDDTIFITLFGQAFEKNFNWIKEGRSYSVSKGILKENKLSKDVHPYWIMIKESVLIEEVEEIEDVEGINDESPKRVSEEVKISYSKPFLQNNKQKIPNSDIIKPLSKPININKDEKSSPNSSPTQDPNQKLSRSFLNPHDFPTITAIQLQYIQINPSQSIRSKYSFDGILKSIISTENRPIYYYSCLDSKCKKKIEFHSNGNFYCPKCKSLTAESIPRYNVLLDLYDETGSFLATAFDEVAADMLKVKAIDYTAMYRANNKKAEAWLKNFSGRLIIAVIECMGMNNQGKVNFICQSLHLKT